LYSFAVRECGSGGINVHILKDNWSIFFAHGETLEEAVVKLREQLQGIYADVTSGLGILSQIREVVI
jgi:hypothetical protein